MIADRRTDGPGLRGRCTRSSCALVLAVAAAGVVAGCDPPAPRCDQPAATALTAVDRKLVGAASPYPADGLLRGREPALAASMAARRAAA